MTGPPYESRLAKADLNYAQIEALSQQVDELVEDEEDSASREKQRVNGVGWKTRGCYASRKTDCRRHNSLF